MRGSGQCPLTPVMLPTPSHPRTLSTATTTCAMSSATPSSVETLNPMSPNPIQHHLERGHDRVGGLQRDALLRLNPKPDIPRPYQPAP